MSATRSTKLCAALVIAATLSAFPLESGRAHEAGGKPFTVEYYYKIKWGYFGRFMDLYEKNHYPVLQRLQEQGDILSMVAHYPIDHAGESDRWDFRYTIVFKDVDTAFTGISMAAIVADLYPDKDRFEQEEQERFSLIIEHRDVPVIVDDLSDWGQASHDDAE